MSDKKILQTGEVKSVDIYHTLDMLVYRNYTFRKEGSERMSFVPAKPFGVIVVCKRGDDPDAGEGLYKWVVYKYAQLDITYPWYVDTKLVAVDSVRAQGWYHTNSEGWARMGVKRT